MKLIQKQLPSHDRVEVGTERQPEVPKKEKSNPTPKRSSKRGNERIKTNTSKSGLEEVYRKTKNNRKNEKEVINRKNQRYD